MAEKLDPKQVITFEELLRACLYEQEALRRYERLVVCPFCFQADGIPVEW